MNADLRKKLESTVERLVNHLVEEEYSEIASLTNNRRLTETQIRHAIAEYGRTLVRPPDTFRECIDIVPVADSNPQRWSVDFPLWTLEEDESDLSVEITCIDNKDGEYEVELDNIHVL